MIFPMEILNVEMIVGITMVRMCWNLAEATSHLATKSLITKQFF